MRKEFLLVLIFKLPFVLFAQTKTYWSPDQCLKMRNVTAVRVSPDGGKVLYTVREAVMTDDRSEYVSQVFLCNADGSNTIQLTRGDKNSSNPKWSPDGKWIGFTSARDGKNNIYALPLAGGEAEKLTDSKSGVNEFKWSPDGKMIAYTMMDAAPDSDENNKKAKNDWYFYDDDRKQNRIYALWLNEKDTADKRKSKLLTRQNRNVISFDWSPDNKQIVFDHGASPLFNDNLYSDMSIVDVQSGDEKYVAKTGAGESSPLFSPDGKNIAYLLSEDPVIWGGKTWIAITTAAGSAPRKLALTPDANPTLLGWSSDGTHLYAGENNRTLFTVYSVGIDGKEITELTKGNTDLLSVPSLNPGSSYWGFTLQNTFKPAEAYTSPAGHFSPVEISDVNSAISKSPVPKTEMIKWKSFDGKEIEGLLTYPVNYQAGKKYPMILNVHGGPAGVFTQNFIASNQAAYPIASLSEAGMFVLRPNPRGSGGYGVTFRLANQRDWGGADFKDLMAGVDYVIRTGMVDENKLGVMGWSYGGFMTSWIVGHTDRFKAASIGAPVVDLSFQNMTDDIPGFLPSYMKTDPWLDWAVYDTHSPLRYVQNVKTPVMLQHGEADVRVPIGNSIMFYHALKRRGIPVRLLALPRQTHGPSEPRMILKVMQSNLDWFQKYLGENKAF